MGLERITKNNFVPPGNNPRFRVYDYWYNIVVDKINAITSVTEASSKILTAADSGKTFFIDGSTAASNFTLPAPEAGLKYKFIWTANNTNLIKISVADTTDTTGDLFVGGLLICSAAAVNSFEEAGATVNTLSVDDNGADLAGGIGTWIEIICVEDPLWCVIGVINSSTDADSTGVHLTHV